MLYRNIILKQKDRFLDFNNYTKYDYLFIFRIFVGFIAIVDIISLQDDLKLFYSSKDSIIPQELSYLFSEYFEYLNPVYNLLAENNVLDFFYDYSIISYIILLFCLISGFLTRISAILVLFLQLFIFKSFALFNYGYDHFLTMSLFYCIIFPVGKVKSIDNILFKSNDIIKYNFNYQKVLRINLCIIYFFSGLAKSVTITWFNGEAVWRSISSIYDDMFLINPYILALVGICTVLLEIGFAFLVNYNKTRKFCVYITILMHISIAFFLNLPLFAAIMIIWNITAFYELFDKKSQIQII